ncbi:MAG: hypothetical protein M1549_00790 [Candidatus Dependentiae bacterium]|nr:hypothetical protein [Candidatus Dependentiae bacterium]
MKTMLRTGGLVAVLTTAAVPCWGVGKEICRALGCCPILLRNTQYEQEYEVFEKKLTKLYTVEKSPTKTEEMILLAAKVNESASTLTAFTHGICKNQSCGIKNELVFQYNCMAPLMSRIIEQALEKNYLAMDKTYTELRRRYSTIKNGLKPCPSLQAGVCAKIASLLLEPLTALKKGLETIEKSGPGSAGALAYTDFTKSNVLKKCQAIVYLMPENIEKNASCFGCLKADDLAQRLRPLLRDEIDAGGLLSNNVETKKKAQDGIEKLDQLITALSLP